MAIEAVAPEDVVIEARRQFGLMGGGVDEIFLAACVRRAAALGGGAARPTLLRQCAAALAHLAGADLADRLDAVIESLTVGGDLLELDAVASGETKASATWLFPAPFGFVMTRGANAHLVGMGRDDLVPLPDTLKSRVVYDGSRRLLAPQAGEDLRGLLADLGLPEIAEAVWLKAPKAETAAGHLARMKCKLDQRGPSGSIPDLQVLDFSSSPAFYRGRWTTSANRSGVYIARRPQAYQADRWGLAQLQAGECMKFLDLPLANSRWRGCDVAWHTQMAIDAERSAPQVYRKVAAADAVRFDFFSPLPLWAQRRLAVVGRPANAEKCLLSFAVDASEAEAEEQVLRDRLWLAPWEGGA